MTDKKKNSLKVEQLLQQRQFVSIPQLSELLGISRIAVYNKVKKGQIKSIRVGRNYAVPTDYIKTNLVDIKTLFTDSQVDPVIQKVVQKSMQDFKGVFRKLGKK